MRSRLPLRLISGLIAFGLVGGLLVFNAGLLRKIPAGIAAAPSMPPSASPRASVSESEAATSPSAPSASLSPSPSPSPSTLGPGVTSCPATVTASLAPSRSPSAARQVLRVPVLMYHRIVPPAEAGNSLPSLVVPPETFAQQMATLAGAGWKTITLAALAADLARGMTPPQRTFVATFDDGYDDGFLYALPILRKHGFVGTFFIVPGRVGGRSILSADHVRALAAAGMEIADHTMNHADLPVLDQAAMRYQIGAAAAAIGRMTGQPPTTFAYPFGDRDQRVIQQVALCGFAMAVTNVEGVGETWAGRFIVPRVRVGPGTTPQMLLYLVSHPAPPAPPSTPRPAPTPRPTLRRTPPPVIVTPRPSQVRTPAPSMPAPSTPTPTAVPTPTPTPTKSPTPS